MRYSRAIRGISVVEVIIAIAIFSIISSIAYAGYLNANMLSERASMKSEALWLAEEGIEATRSIRDQGFSNLTVGTKGLSRTTGTWQFSGTSDTIDGFVRSIVLASGETDIVNATSTVSWYQDNATTSVSLGSTLTNWRRVPDTIANHFTIATTSACVYSSDGRSLGGITITYDGIMGTVTIPQMQVSWVSTTRTLNQIFAPSPTSVWTGTAASNATTTLTTPVSFASAGSRGLTYRWDASVAGKSFTIKLIFSDASTKSVTLTTPPSGTCI